MPKSFEDILKPLEIQLGKRTYDILLRLGKSTWEKKEGEDTWENTQDLAIRATKLRVKLLGMIKDTPATATTDDAIYEAIQQIVHEYPKNKGGATRDGVETFECPISLEAIIFENPEETAERRDEKYAYSCVSGDIYVKDALLEYFNTNRENRDPGNRLPYSAYELRRLGMNPADINRLRTANDIALADLQERRLNCLLRYALLPTALVVSIPIIVGYLLLSGDYTERWGNDRSLGEALGGTFACLAAMILLFSRFQVHHPRRGGNQMDYYLAQLSAPLAVMLYIKMGWVVSDIVKENNASSQAVLSADILTTLLMGLYAGYYVLRLTRSYRALAQPRGIADEQQIIFAKKQRNQALLSLIAPVLVYGLVQVVAAGGGGESASPPPGTPTNVNEVTLTFTVITMIIAMYFHIRDPAQREVLRFADAGRRNDNPRNPQQRPLLSPV